MDKKTYNKYTEDLEQSANTIQLPKSVRTERKGVGGIRDKIVFYKQVWTVAETWAGLPKALVYWLALTPLAIVSFNAFVSMLGIPIEIPLGYGSVIAVLTVVLLMVFGFLAWTKLGLNRRSMELGGKQNPNYFLFYNKFENILEEIKELKKEINELKKNN